MVCSPEQLAANRRNSAKSTGPTSARGKATSRRNGLKHGLTGAGVALPDEDAGAVQDRFEAFQADLKPRNDVATFLVHRAAMLSVRLERCAREESARLTREMIEAAHDEEDARFEELDFLFELLEAKPVEAVRRLKRTPEGLGRLIEAFRERKFQLFQDGMPAWDIRAAQRLFGVPPDLTIRSRTAALNRGLRGDFSFLGPDDWPGLSPGGRMAAARAELGRIIDDEIARLEALRDGFDRESIARLRGGAAARAIFDASRGATLARKYEAAAERAFFKTLDAIEHANATEDEPDQADANSDEEKDSEELASDFPGPVGSRPARPSRLPVDPTTPIGDGGRAEGISHLRKAGPPAHHTDGKELVTARK